MLLTFGAFFCGLWVLDASAAEMIRRADSYVTVALGGCWFLRRPARRWPGRRGATIAVRSLRSGLPLPHPRGRLRRLPSDSVGLIDAPRLPGHHRAELCQLPLASAGAGGVRRVLFGACVAPNILRGSPHAGRAGGLLGLVRCLASPGGAQVVVDSFLFHYSPRFARQFSEAFPVVLREPSQMSKPHAQRHFRDAGGCLRP